MTPPSQEVSTANEFRKAFSASERAAIAEAVERNLENRQGRRMDQLPGNCREVPLGTETKEFAVSWKYWAESASSFLHYSGSGPF